MEYVFFLKCTRDDELNRSNKKPFDALENGFVMKVKFQIVQNNVKNIKNVYIYLYINHRATVYHTYLKTSDWNISETE